MKTIFLLASCIVILGCDILKSNSEKDFNPTKFLEKNSTSQEHNFELIQLGTMRRDQYLLDKKTGQIWRSVCLYSKPRSQRSECEYSGWVKESIQDIDGLSIEAMNNYSELLKKRYEK